MIPVGTNQIEFKQYFPKSGWVEHDPQDLWSTTLETCGSAIKVQVLNLQKLLLLELLISVRL